MRITRSTHAAVGTALLLAVTLTACAQDDAPGTDAPSATSDSASAPAEAEQLLAEYGLAGMGTTEIIDQLDRLGAAERPTEMIASVLPGELKVFTETEEFSLGLPGDRFYLSVAPYVHQTHDCFYHSLTTCTGELSSAEVHVQIVDETHDKVLVDDTRTTFENGFTGFWLPRDIEGTLRVTYDGKVGEVDFSTHADAPTCLTTLQLV